MVYKLTSQPWGDGQGTCPSLALTMNTRWARDAILFMATSCWRLRSSANSSSCSVCSGDFTSTCQGDVTRGQGQDNDSTCGHGGGGRRGQRQRQKVQRCPYLVKVVAEHAISEPVRDNLQWLIGRGGHKHVLQLFVVDLRVL
jgi:hypothetical protein